MKPDLDSILCYIGFVVCGAILFCLLTGCSTASIVKQLKNDHANVRLRVNGWGTVIELDRTNPQQTNAVLKTP